MKLSPRLQAFLEGVRAELPLLIGVFPFGMIYGILALDAGLSPAEAQAMSSIVFAGSSQFAAAQLFHSATPALVIVLTIAVINARHLLYSASIAPFTQKLSPLWKAVLAYLLTDEAYAVGITHYYKLAEQKPNATTKDSPSSGHWYYAGAGLALWSTWQISTAAGVFLGAAVPASWPLDFTLPLTFIALVVPGLKTRPAVAAALTAGITALLFSHFPYRLGLIAAALAGLAAGLLIERRQ